MFGMPLRHQALPAAALQAACAVQNSRVGGDLHGGAAPGDACVGCQLAGPARIQSGRITLREVAQILSAITERFGAARVLMAALVCRHATHLAIPRWQIPLKQLQDSIDFFCVKFFAHLSVAANAVPNLVDLALRIALYNGQRDRRQPRK